MKTVDCDLLVVPDGKELEWHLRRVGLLCVVILPLLLAPQASDLARPNEFPEAGTASVPLQPAIADQYVPLQNAVQVAVGGRHTCALISSSKADASLSEAAKDPETAGYAVKCWGDNWFAEPGDGMERRYSTNRRTPVDVAGLNGGVLAISAGGWHSCALTTSGGVKCWGWNTYGQLGDGTQTDRGVGLSVPVDVIGLSSGVYAIAAGGRHTCALVSSGKGSAAQSTTTDKPGPEGFGVKCWGDNSHGQLGDGTQTVRTTPVDVLGLSSGVYAIAAGGRHTCALVSSGKSSATQSTTTDKPGPEGFDAKCWGDNVHGQLGDGTQTVRTTPVDVLELSGGVYAIVAGGGHTCALTHSGQSSASSTATADNPGAEGFAVKCWGDNSQGQLGDGTTTSRSIAEDVKGLSSGVHTIVAGGGHTCALISSSQGSTSLSPTADSSGAGDFAVKCWGANNRGQLGNGAKTEWRARRLIPVDVVGLHSGLHAIAAGGWHTCALIGSGGVKCWGDNQHDQLGEGSTDRTTPVDVVGLSSGVYAISSGGRHTCALTIAGGVQCWGANWAGQLGDGTKRERRIPVNVVGLSSGVHAIAVSGGGEHQWHTCVLTSNSQGSASPQMMTESSGKEGFAVKCWGDNDHGQLGNGTQTDRRVPVDVVGLSSGVYAIAAGTMHTCALTDSVQASVPLSADSSGTEGFAVKCWGANNRGQLGDGTHTDRLVPVDVAGLSSGVQAIAAGGRHTCALTRAGGVKCWGDNGLGQVGDGSRLIPFLTNRPWPVDVKGLSSGVQALAAGAKHTCALTTRGGVKCWGNNGSGVLGAPTRRSYQSTSVDVVGLNRGVHAIAASAYHTCALTNAGGVKCWGSNTNGQLGNGTTTVGDTANPIPEDVVGLNSGVYAITAGELHTCAITSGAEGPARQLSVSAEPFAGGVKCWGASRSNQIGDGMGGVSRSAPVDVSGH